MKKLELLFLCVLTCLFTACMDHHEVPTDIVYGNNTIGEANTTIKELKEKYLDIALANGVKQVEENIIISGVVVGDDESGNIYKQLYIKDESAVIVVGINTTGLYSYIPVGQKVVIDCKGLYVGGYGSQMQIGYLFKGAIGRMPEQIWKQHVRLVGAPTLSHPELVPQTIDENWLSSADKNEAPFYVKLENVQIKEADGYTVYAPEKEADGGGGVNRTLILGSKTLPFRISSYANFANDYMPIGNIELTGLLTRYNNDWQITVRTSRDIKK